MSLPQPRKAADTHSAVDAEEQLFTSATAEEGAHLPSVNAQRVNEATLRLVSCAGARRDEDVVPEEVLIPYAAPVEGVEEGEGPPPTGGWWKSSGLAIAMHVAIVAALVWVMPTPAELNLGAGEMPKAMQVSVVTLPPKPEPVQQPPAAAPTPPPPEPEPPKPIEPPKPVEKPKPKPKPVEKAVPKVSPKPKPKPKPEPDPEPAEEAVAPPTPAAPPPPAAPTVGQFTQGAQAAPTGSQGPAGLPTGSLNDSDIKPLRMDPPVYPRMALTRSIEGRVKVLFTITSDGRIADIQVLESSPPRMFDNAVRDAMDKWRFEPRVSGGRIVARQATKVFFFKLEGRR
ncbi:energy transducer TonB [Pseudomonas sp. PDNC002]|uniref:energy transducer TonB n=1 Tax=Pseudomonas sp. PDNC002 TaxID=2811422 RepID=UPI00196473FC|nr:energy transducer TonB [Pseudomonas sp. PDNC002]QRY80728.1 energy transducer TonB [Pseudomonas sp. PDNC002]